MAAPTYTPLPTAPARTMTPTAFAVAADAFVAALATFQTEGDTLGAYTQTQAEAALAAAIAGNLAALDLSALAGWVIGVNNAGDALEGVELVPAMEVFQSKITLSNDGNVDFVLASGVDEHIFTLRGITSDNNASYMYMKYSDDNKSTFESVAFQRRWNSGAYTDDVGDTMALVNSWDSNPASGGIEGQIILSQLSGMYAHAKGETVFYYTTDNAPRQQKSDGYVLTTAALTDVRFYISNAGSSFLSAGEIIYTTRTYA